MGATNNYVKVTAAGVHEVYFFDDCDAESKHAAFAAARERARCADFGKTADQLAYGRARMSVYQWTGDMPSGVDVVGVSRWLS